MTTKHQRRDFLKATATATAGLLAAAPSAQAGKRSADQPLNHAAIGAGGMGAGDVRGMAEAGANIVALCDVDEKRAAKSRERFPKAKFFRDFRALFDQMGAQIDSVTVSTPDHTHYAASMMALKLGKHVRTQKPLTHDVWEARMLKEEAARRPDQVTAMGNQGTTHDGFREAVEVIQSGAIGTPQEVHVWTNRPDWPQGTQAILNHGGVAAALTGQGAAAKAPSEFDWDLWLGTAPWRPYDPCYIPSDWRAWWDYGTGALGDMACHTANMAFMACEIWDGVYPTRVAAELSEYNPHTYPTWSVLTYDFPSRQGRSGQLPELKWVWYDGGADKPKWVVPHLRKLAHGRTIPESGSIIIGDQGTLFSPNDYGSAYTLLPEEKFKDYKPPSPRLPRIGGDSYGEFVRAIQNGDPNGVMSNFGYAGPLTETVVLGCVAMRAKDRLLVWDGPNMKVTNDPEANQHLRREYREGW
jgi:predicted dehydrogenase